jgi:hypothetical protein
MDNRRSSERKTPGFEIEVFDLHSGQHLGRVVDISAEGLMLFSEVAIEVDSVMQFRLICEREVPGIKDIELGADCLWSRPAGSYPHCWAGFLIIDIADVDAQALQILLDQLPSS